MEGRGQGNQKNDMANEVIIELIARTEAAQGKIDALEGEIKGMKQATEKATGATTQLTEKLDQMTGGAITGFKGLVGGIKNGIKSLKTFKAAAAATGIGALVIAVGTLATAFTRTQKGAEAFDRITGTLSATIDVVLDRVATLGLAVMSLFDGDFQEAARLAREAFSDIGKEIKEETEIARELADAENELEKAEAELVLTSAKRLAQIEDLKLTAEDATKSERERLAAVREAIRLEREEADERVRIAQERTRIVKLQNEQGYSRTEAIRREREAEAELFNVQRDRDSRLKELTARLNSLTQAEEKHTLSVEARIAAMKEDIAMEEEDEALFEEAFNAEIERITIRSEAEKKAHLERIDQQIKEGENAEQIAKQKERAEKQFADARIALAQTGLNVIGEIFGRESAAGKAAAIASATIDTYKAFTNALANTPLPPPGPQIAAGLTLASGFAQVRNILSTPIPNGFGGGGGASAGRGGAPTPSLPNVSILGGNEAMTQATRSLAQFGKKPTRAYVVSGEMTDNQALDRRIERNASFG